MYEFCTTNMSMYYKHQTMKAKLFDIHVHSRTLAVIMMMQECLGHSEHVSSAMVLTLSGGKSAITMEMVQIFSIQDDWMIITGGIIVLFFPLILIDIYT